MESKLLKVKLFHRIKNTFIGKMTRFVGKIEFRYEEIEILRSNWALISAIIPTIG